MRGDHVYFKPERRKQNKIDKNKHSGSWLRDPNRGGQRESPVGLDTVFMKHSKIYHMSMNPNSTNDQARRIPYISFLKGTQSQHQY